MALFVVRYTCNIIYHSFPINSQYLITWGLDSPAKCGRHKIQFHEYAARLINPKNSLPPSSQNCSLTQDCKAWKCMEVDCWHHWEPQEHLSYTERKRESRTDAENG